MDVITVAQLENHMAKNRFLSSKRKNPVRQRGGYAFGALAADGVPFYAEARKAGVSFMEFVREYPSAVSFPVMLLVAALAVLSLVPIAETRTGFYRTGVRALPSDTAIETSLRRMVVPEVRAENLSAESIASIPESIREVRFSEYRVRNGDTVSAIQHRSGLRNLSSILSVNNIDNARRIRPGQLLRIPSTDGIQYTVVRGDSLQGIANRYGIEVTSLLDANDLANATLVPGQNLFIPGASLSTMALRRAMGELFLTPLRGRLTSPYGYRRDPFTGVRTFHTGIDLAAPVGTPIKATLDGRIATTGYSAVYGNYVIITHDGGYQSLYAHMHRIQVKRGQWVTQGGILGLVGNTGYSTGPHLHFSVYRNGKMVNPASLLN